MNVENMKLVRDHVAANVGFRLDIAYYTCGSPACIMGSAEAVSGIRPEHDTGSPDSERIARWLEISDREYFYIYLGDFSNNPSDMVKKKEALDYLDLCIAEGRVVHMSPTQLEKHFQNEY